MFVCASIHVMCMDFYDVPGTLTFSFLLPDISPAFKIYRCFFLGINIASSIKKTCLQWSGGKFCGKRWRKVHVRRSRLLIK